MNCPSFLDSKEGPVVAKSYGRNNFSSLLTI